MHTFVKTGFSLIALYCEHMIFPQLTSIIRLFTSFLLGEQTDGESCPLTREIASLQHAHIVD